MSHSNLKGVGTDGNCNYLDTDILGRESHPVGHMGPRVISDLSF